MKIEYKVRSAHVFVEPHNTLRYQWQVLSRRDDGFRWWVLVGVYETRDEAKAVARELTEAALLEQQIEGDHHQ